MQRPGTKVLYANGIALPKTGCFKYLGGWLGIDYTLGTSMDVNSRIGQANAVFGQLTHVWRSRQISRATKARLFKACVVPVLLYGSECWALSAGLIRQLARTYMSFVRRCLCITFDPNTEVRYTHAQMLHMLGVPSLLTLLQQRLAMWMGHVARMSPDRHPHAALFGVPAGRSFSSGGHHSFVSRAKALLQQLPGIDERTWPVTAQDRQRWSRLVEQLEIVPQVRGVDGDDKYFSFPGRARSSEAQGNSVCCPDCDYVARNTQGLRRHISQKHATGDRVWRCSHCGKEFVRKGALTTHLETCVMARGPPADPRVAPAPARPKRAAARTLAARPHVCRACGLDFPHESGLNRHTREQCLARPGSGATLQPDGRWAFACNHPSCVGSSDRYYSTRAFSLHKKLSHGR